MEKTPVAASFDASIEEMIRADEIRATLVPGSSKTFYLIGEPWSMLEEPWRCQWFDHRINATCQVYPVGAPYSGDKYAMFTVYMEDTKDIKNYVFLMDQYHFFEGDDETVDD